MFMIFIILVIEGCAYNMDSLSDSSVDSRENYKNDIVLGSVDSRENYKNDIVLGSVDSLITVMSIVSTFHALHGGPHLVLMVIVLGLSNVISDGISMMSSRYLSRRINTDHASAMSSGFYTWLSFTTSGFIPLIPFILPISTQLKFTSSYIVAFIVLLVAIMIGYDMSMDKLQENKAQIIISIIIPIVTVGIAYFIGSMFSYVRKI